MYTAPLGTIVDFNLAVPNYKTPASSRVNFYLGQSGVPPQATAVPSAISTINLAWVKPERHNQDRREGWNDATERQLSTRINIDSASVITDQGRSGRWKPATQQDKGRGIAWEPANPYDQSAALAYKQAIAKDRDRARIRWQIAGVILDYTKSSAFLIKTPYKDTKKSEQWFTTDDFGPLWRRPQNLPAELANPVIGRADFGFLQLRRAEIGTPTRMPIAPAFQPHPSQPKEYIVQGPWLVGAPVNSRYQIPWGPGGQRDKTLNFDYEDYEGPITDPGDTIIAIELETHLTMNTVNVKRVSDQTPIDMQDITIALDTDSWAWAITGQVLGTAGLAMIEPTAQGLIDIEVEINGHTWIFMIESYSGNRKHSDERFNVRGVSRTQILAYPYASQISGNVSSTAQATQVIDDALFGTGFTIGWQTTPSWAIEAGAFSYQDLSPLALAKRIADAAGAILVPHKANQSLTLQPRLPISPWALTAATLGQLDAQIPMSMVNQQSLNYEPAPLYDSIYLSGTTKGVANLVELFGSGGLLQAPDVFDDLLTDTDVTQERARQEIGNSGAKGIYSITLPIPEALIAPGLLEPGMMIETVEGNTTWRGYVLGVSISAPRSGAAKVEQTATIVRFYEHE